MRAILRMLFTDTPVPIHADASLEVKASGLNTNRHVVTVNGRALPLQPTGRGELVTGLGPLGGRAERAQHLEVVADRALAD